MSILIGDKALSGGYIGDKQIQKIFNGTTQVYSAEQGGIYGARWGGTSSPAWERTDDAASFADPNPYYSGMATTPSSPFDNIMPWAGMVRSTNASAGEVVAIPKFWYKLESYNSTGLSIKISNTAQTGFSVSPAHMDRGDGRGERSVIYVGRYHCGSDYKSTSGVLPKGSINVSTARTGISSLGSAIWQWDFATIFTIWMLYLVEFANWDSQAKIGYGCAITNNTQMSMGYTDSMGYHTGTNRTSRTTYGGTQYRYIEGLWDNVVDWVDGVTYSDTGSSVFVIVNPNNFGSTGTNVGSATGGYGSSFAISSVTGYEWIWLPTANSGSRTTYTCDYISFSATASNIWHGGDCYQWQDAGIGCFYGQNTATVSTGSRLMILP